MASTNGHAPDATSLSEARPSAENLQAANNDNAIGSSYLDKMPGEILTMIAKQLEPDIEIHLSEAFIDLVDEVIIQSRWRHKVNTKSPNSDEIREHGGPANWRAHVTNLQNFALTSKKIFGHTNTLRVALLYTPEQLVKLFLFILTTPQRRHDVESLQLHQALFLPYQDDVLKTILEDVKSNKGWDILHIAGMVFRAAGYGSPALTRNTRTVILATALIHLLPRVSTLYRPYSQGWLVDRFRMKSLDHTGPPGLSSISVKLPYTRLPQASRGLTLQLNSVGSDRLKSLQFNGVANFQSHDTSPDGYRRPKLRGPLDFWTAVATAGAYRGLESLEFIRINDPLPQSPLPPTLSFPSLRSLRFHTVNVQEGDLLRLMPTVPALETLEVFFTRGFRDGFYNGQVSESKQRQIDNNIESFPQGIKSLTLVYLVEHYNISSRRRPMIQQRLRFQNLDKLSNLVFLGIDVSSLVSHPSREDVPALAPLPPNLQYLRVYSVTNGAWKLYGPAWDLRGPTWQHVGQSFDEQIQQYIGLVMELTRTLCADPHNKLRVVEFMRPMQFDSILQEAQGDDERALKTRQSQHLSEEVIRAVPDMERRVLDALQKATKELWDRCQIRVKVNWSLQDQMGGDNVTDRRDGAFWDR